MESYLVDKTVVVLDKRLEGLVESLILIPRLSSKSSEGIKHSCFNFI